MPRSRQIATGWSGPTPKAIKMPRELIGLRIKFAIAQANVLVNQRCGFGGSSNLLHKQLVDATLGWERCGGLVPCVQNELALLGGHNINPIDDLIGVGDHGPQHDDQVVPVALDRRFVKQRRCIVQGADDAAARLAQREFEIELDLLQRDIGNLGLKAGQFKFCRFVALPGEHDLKDRCMVQPPRRLDDLDELLERQVLMILSRQRRAADAAKQLRHIRLSRHIHAERQHIDEEADEALDFTPVAVGRRRTNHKVGLAGKF